MIKKTSEFSKSKKIIIADTKKSVIQKSSIKKPKISIRKIEKGTLVKVTAPFKSDIKRVDGKDPVVFAMVMSEPFEYALRTNTKLVRNPNGSYKKVKESYFVKVASTSTSCMVELFHQDYGVFEKKLLDCEVIK